MNIIFPDHFLFSPNLLQLPLWHSLFFFALRLNNLSNTWCLGNVHVHVQPYMYTMIQFMAFFTENLQIIDIDTVVGYQNGTRARPIKLTIDGMGRRSYIHVIPVQGGWIDHPPCTWGINYRSTPMIDGNAININYHVNITR